MDFGDNQEEGADTAVVEVGRVWRIAAVTADTSKSKWENANSFAALAKEDEEDMDEGDFPKLIEFEMRRLL